MNTRLKKLLTMVLAIMLCCAALIGCGSDDAEEPKKEEVVETTEAIPVETVESTTEPTEAVLTADTYIDDVVDRYNAQATEQLVFAESFDPQDKDSNHYRVEFRLSAYDDAIGKSYLLGDKVVDLIASEGWNGIDFRVYTNDVSLEQVIALIQGMSPIMDATLSEEDLQTTIDKVSTEKTANGYYYGELGITLFGSDVKGYELMIKTD